MKKIFLFAVICIVIILNQSCSTDFKIGAPYKDVTIVFGLLDKGDTAHYIKITRGFLDEKANNLITAKNSDSLYYDTLTVMISKIDGNGNALENYFLQKVNLTTEGYIKDTGVFVTNPSYAYKFKKALDPNYSYKLTITNPKNNKVTTSVTSVLDNTKFDCDFLDLPNPLLSFVDYTNPTTFIYTPPPTSGVVEMYLRFHWYETKNGSQFGVLKSTDLPIFTNKTVTSGIMDYNFNNNDFLGLVGSGLPSTTIDVQRFVDSSDVIFYAGDTTLKKYIDITNAQGGITADEIKPIYTNMVGNGSYGIFGSRVTKIIKNIPFTKATIDTLISSPNAKSLQIVGASPI